MTASAMQHSMALDIPVAHSCFADHFPGRPIVPGALLLQWLCERLEAQYPGRRVALVVTMKFLATLAPGDHCVLELGDAGADRVKLVLARDGAPICKATVQMEPVEDSL